MFPDPACDGVVVAGDTLTAGLLVATGADKAKRSWVRYIRIGVFIYRIRSHYYRIKGSPEPADAVSEQPLLLDSSTPASAQAQPDVVINISSPRPQWDSIVRIVKERDLKSLRELGGFRGVQSVLRDDQTTRYFQDEDVVANGGQDPPAWITISSTNGFSYFLRHAFCRNTIFLLLVSAGLCFAIDIIKEKGPKNGWHNGTAILIATSVLVFCPSINNFLRERKIGKKLSKDFNKLEVNVVRNGKHMLLPIPQVLVRDTVNLVKGDRVPADGLFLGGVNGGEYLVLDEVLNSKIDMNRNPFLSAGSKVVEGSGQMVVTSIGANTAWGDEVLSLVSAHDYSNKKTILQSVTDKSYGYMDNLALCVTVLIAFEVLIRLLVLEELDSDDNESPELKGEVSLKFVMGVFERVLLKPQGKVSIFASILVTIVVGIQHGMLIVITVSLCRWKEKLELNQVDPHNLSACGSMGLVTVIFLDATGDFICNKMEVKEFWIGEGNILLSSAEIDSETDQSVIEALRRGIGFLNEVSVTSPTTDFLISWMKCRWNPSIDFSNTNFNILKYKRLSSSKKVSGVLMRKGTEEDHDQEKDNTTHVYWKGSASAILEMCSHFYDRRGEKYAMEDQKELFEKVIKEMEEKGVWPIAFACGITEVEELKEDGLDLLAIVGVKYLCREETVSVVDDLRKAGVIVKLVSEDELSAVRNIAWDLGFFKQGSNDVATEGKEIREMVRTESARIERVELATVIGSLLPQDKFLMVDYSQRNGHVVAFHGGLTTCDAPALKKADIAITDEIRCTEKAREFSDISIRDMSSLSLIFKHGRCAYRNTQKFFQLQLTALISGLTMAVIATLHSGDSPLKALHLMWMNLILCIVGGFMMVMDLQGQELQHTSQPAKSRTQLLVSKVMWRNITIQVLYQTCIFFIFEFGGHALPFIEEDVGKTMIFNIFILCQLFNLFNVMELEKKEVFEVVRHSYWFLVALGAVTVMQILIIEFGKEVVSCERLNAAQWTYSFFFAALSWGFDRAIKQLSASAPSFSLASELAGLFPNRRPFLPYASYLSFPIFFMILLVSVSYFHPHIGYGRY
ncbi:hypothetical protein FNV43_RR12961 [Rhamnella rubrinervis]|uniref:Cation-transporting P-type ATPase C-terminal domain-containing protein n=1 Tax=Rhamnella rubrinervis TaxID=2594499 RepID=A0A8K0H073_9ROSA|nr:hypothetical protein FNV43_RR12961 [Rhamnella rubrinervis]